MSLALTFVVEEVGVPTFEFVGERESPPPSNVVD